MIECTGRGTNVCKRGTATPRCTRIERDLHTQAKIVGEARGEATISFELSNERKTREREKRTKGFARFYCRMRFYCRRFEPGRSGFHQSFNCQAIFA